MQVLVVIQFRFEHIGFSETKFLGFLVSKTGISVCPSRNDFIKNYPRRRSQKEDRSFLGLASYYRKFILDYATMAAPLTELTKKTFLRNFKWSDGSDEAFKTLKERLLCPPILIYPDYKKRFRNSTDASNVTLYPYVY